MIEKDVIDRPTYWLNVADPEAVDRIWDILWKEFYSEESGGLKGLTKEEAMREIDAAVEKVLEVVARHDGCNHPHARQQ